MMHGPTAPKDAEKKRPFFYIMRDKDIFGAKQQSGKGVQFIYQNDGRLISSARITGNVTEEKELEMLETAEGFRRLVHSIGVSMETEDREEEGEFIYQFYGSNDTYGGGTVLKKRLKGNGAEVRLYLNEVQWKAEDKEPGQIRFEMDTPLLSANVSVRFYLNDGFTTPEAEEDEKVDFTSESYQELLERSLQSMGNPARLQKAIEKASQGEEVALAFIGGSITQGAGAVPISEKSYACQTFQKFSKAFGKGENIRLLKAGVGGTPSELGMIRFERDILRKSEKPDVIVIEFGVNDEGDETKGDCYESLVRKALSLPWEPAVILLFAVFADDFNLQERLSPIGRAYELPMVSIKNAVTEQFYKKRGEGRVLSKNQFFYDRYHPSNIGHTIMADCLMHLFHKAYEGKQEETLVDRTKEYLERPPVIGKTFEKIKLLDRCTTYEKAQIYCGSFEGTDKMLQSVEMDENLTPIPQFPYNWHYAGETKAKQESFRMEIECRALVLVFKDSGEIDAGRAEVFVDGKKKLTADPAINGWVHCNPVILFTEKESSKHFVALNMVKGDERKKFTILGFGYVE